MGYFTSFDHIVRYLIVNSFASSNAFDALFNQNERQKKRPQPIEDETPTKRRLMKIEAEKCGAQRKIQSTKLQTLLLLLEIKIFGWKLNKD